jgi:cytoskeletal protein CcmA (bactofilin family)
VTVKNMLGRKPDEKPSGSIDTLVGNKTELKGDIAFTGGLRVDGKVRGNVTAKGDGGSVLVISEQGEVEGTINVPHVVINGVVNGNLTSTVSVELQAKARIFGDVHYRTLKMEMGASVNGNLVCEGDQAERAGPKPVSVGEQKNVSAMG